MGTLASFSVEQKLILLLVLSPFIAALLAPAVGFLARVTALKAWERRLEDAITIIASAVSLGLALWLARRLAMEGVDAYQFSVLIVDFYVDALSIYFVLLVNVIAFAASLYTGAYLEALAVRYSPESFHPTRFHFFFNLFHFTMVLVPMVDNLVFLWIAVELTTVASAFLVGYRQDRRALEAAWKYTIITSTGIILALLGTLFLANAIPGNIPGEPGGRNLTPGGLPVPELSMRWSDLIQMARGETLGHPLPTEVTQAGVGRVSRELNKGFVILSFLFILIGYGTKAGFAPMHTWLPDGHGEAPYPVSALLSGVLLKSALYAILRFYTIANVVLGRGNAPAATIVSTVLLVTGLLSLVVAVPFILKDNRFKRVLAYHSLEHMGIIAFGLGIGNNVAIFGALLHALNHALTKALMFLTFGTVQGSYARVGGNEEERYVGVLQAMPFTGLAMALGGLALVGSPPFNIFFSEFLILWGAFSRAKAHTSLGMVGAIVLFLLSVTLIFGGLVRHLGRMLIGTPPEGTTGERPEQWMPLFVLLGVVFLFGITVPGPWPIDLPMLLQKSVDIVKCGVPGCP